MEGHRRDRISALTSEVWYKHFLEEEIVQVDLERKSQQRNGMIMFE